MASSIQLVQYPGLTRKSTLSPPCGKVHMALRLKGLDYDIKNVRNPQEAKRYNPRGRVPSLILDGETFVDSTDILTELDRRFPDPPLLPDGALARAHVKVYEDWADEVLYFYGVQLRWRDPEAFERMKRHVLSRLPVPIKWIVPSIARRVTRKRTQEQGVGLKGCAVALREFVECYETLATLLVPGPFLVGDRITRADLALASVLDQHRIEKLTPKMAAEINARPALVAWLDRVHELAPSAV